MTGAAHPERDRKAAESKDEPPRFDLDEVFEPEDYLHFYDRLLPDDLSDRQAALIARLLELEPGARVLDVACGHGRIANRLAAAGAAVTGIDRSARFLERAREDAARRGVSVEYVEGDMHAMPWRGAFDAAVSWFTSFGYHDDERNRRALAEMAAVLRPGGRLLLQHPSRDWILRNFSHNAIQERDGDFMLDVNRFDVLSGRLETDRVVIRGGRTRRMHHGVRLFAFPELRDWLVAAGFARAAAYGATGEPFSLDSGRMIVVAEKA